MRPAPLHKSTIITIAGRPGSGKSTTAKMVADALGYDHFSSGDLFREMVHKLGFDLTAGSLHAEQNSEIDVAVDQRLREMGEESTDIVIDSRMAWHWMPNSFRVYLELDSKTAAERIMGALDEKRRAVEHVPESIEEYAQQLDERLASEARRDSALYGVNPYVEDHYDIVINTASSTPEESTQQIIKAYKAWLS